MTARHLILLLALAAPPLAMASVVINPTPTPTPIVVSNANTLTFSGTIPGQADGAVSLTFRIYDSPTVGYGNVLFTETQTVNVVGTAFTAQLGGNTSYGINPDALAGKFDAYVAFTLYGSTTEIGNRTPLRASGTALTLSPGAGVKGDSLRGTLDVLSQQAYNQYGIGVGIQPAVKATSNGFTAAGKFTTSTASTKPAVDTQNSSTAAAAALGNSTATSGTTAGVEGRSASAAGTGGLFINSGGGDILQGRNAVGGAAVFRVANTGDVVVNGAVVPQFGPKGPTGDVGDCGGTGPKGATGFNGPPGPAGSSGPNAHSQWTVCAAASSGSSCNSLCGSASVAHAGGTGLSGACQAISDSGAAACNFTGNGYCCVCN